MEKMMSRSRIWTMAEPRLVTTRWPTRRASSWPGSTLSWISRVAFQIRNRPPAIRIRSRQEKLRSKGGCPSGPGGGDQGTEMTGWVRPTTKAITDSRPSRRTRARPMPMRRARERWSALSLLEMIETKTRLSTPSTTSMITRVTRAAQAVGSAASAKRLCIDAQFPNGYGAHSYRVIGRRKKGVHDRLGGLCWSGVCKPFSRTADQGQVETKATMRDGAGSVESRSLLCSGLRCVPGLARRGGELGVTDRRDQAALGAVFFGAGIVVAALFGAPDALIVAGFAD